MPFFPVKITNGTIISLQLPLFSSLLKPIFHYIAPLTDTVFSDRIFIKYAKCMYTFFWIKSISINIMLKYNHIHTIVSMNLPQIWGNIQKTAIKMPNFDVYLQFFSCFLVSLALSLVILEIFSVKFTQSWVKGTCDKSESGEENISPSI